MNLIIPIVIILVILGALFFILTLKFEINVSDTKNMITDSSEYKSLLSKYSSQNVLLLIKTISKNDARVLNVADNRVKMEDSWIAIANPNRTVDIEGDIFVYQVRKSATFLEEKMLTIIKTSFDSELYIIFYPEEKESIELFRICKKITHPTTRGTCLAIVEENVARCDKITENEKVVENDRKDSCYINVALKANDISLCDKLSMEPYMSNSHTYRFTCKAFLEKSLQRCDEAAQKEVYGGYCYLKLAELTKNSAFCDKYGLDWFVLECKARIEKNIEYCTPETTQPECYSEVAMLTGAVSICDKMPDSPILVSHDISYLNEAKDICKVVAKKDISQLNCEEKYNACMAVAFLTGDTSICEKIVVATWQNPETAPINECYYRMVLIKSGIVPIETVIGNVGRIWEPLPGPVPGCTPEWECSEWSECGVPVRIGTVYTTDTQIRTCTDKNNCRDISTRPPLYQCCRNCG